MRINDTIKQGISLLALCLIAWAVPTQGFISSYSRNDTYPLFSTLDPHTYLQTREKLRLKKQPVDVKHNEWFGLSLSAFGQNANTTRVDCLTAIKECDEPCADTDTCLGNINGRWSMLGLLMGDLPAGKTLSPTLLTAKEVLFPAADSLPTLTSPLIIDRNQNIGFFDVPMHYKKRGVRVDFKAQILKDFGPSFNVGFADICQDIAFIDRTTTGNINGCIEIEQCDLKEFLMLNLKNIAPEICLDIRNFHEFSIEDVRAGAYWRHPIAINTSYKHWEPFLLIPFLHVEGSGAVGKKRNVNQFAALSFGNNDHNSIGASGGLNIDFFETIEIGGEVGVTHFFDRDVCNLSVPTSACQSGIYPFCTDVNIQPGNNWHFGLKMLAYHFLGNLSFHFQYVAIEHQKDCIKVKNGDAAFKPHLLENLSTWKSQLANVGFNYDISPAISLGFLWQTPLPSRNVYRSTTLMLSFNAQY